MQLFIKKYRTYVFGDMLAKYISPYRIEIGIFLLAVFVRLVFFLVCLSSNGGDVVTTVRGQDWYFELSKNLLLGNGFSVYSVPPFIPYSYGVPFYPYFLFFLLWLTGSYLAVSMIQLLLGAVIPLLGMMLSKRITPKDSIYKNIPIVVGFMLALAPGQILHSFIFFTEAIFIVLFVTFLIFFLIFLKNSSFKFAILSGVFLGLSTLTKQTVQYLPILVILFALWQFRKERRKEVFMKLGCFLLVFFITISPWIYRNYKTFHMMSLGSGASFNVFYTLLPSVRAMENHTSFQEEQRKLIVVPNDPMHIASAKLATKEILHHPISLFKLCSVSAFTFFTHDGIVTFMQSAGITVNIPPGKPAIVMLAGDPILFAKTAWGYAHSNIIFALFARLFWIALTLFFFFGIYILFRRRLFTVPIAFVIILVFYFMTTTMINGLAVNARFRMPVEPIIFTVACIGFVSFYAWIKNLFSHYA
jgi:4-amino-4-deoxy-L-arabinose transferase-like glycosyltransferase